MDSSVFDVVLTLALLAPPTIMALWLFVSKMSHAIIKSLLAIACVVAAACASYWLTDPENRMWRLVIGALNGYLALLAVLTVLWLIHRKTDVRENA